MSTLFTGDNMKCRECEYFDEDNMKCKENALIKNDKDDGYKCNYDEIIEAKEDLLLEQQEKRFSKFSIVMNLNFITKAKVEVEENRIVLYIQYSGLRYGDEYFINCETKKDFDKAYTEISEFYKALFNKENKSLYEWTGQ